MPVPSAPRSRSGYTLYEMLLVVVVLAIAAGVAVPRLDGVVARLRTRAALDQLTADLYHARALAAREGHPTVLRFTRRPDLPDCHAPSYSLVVRSDPERVARATDLDLGPAWCFDAGRVDSVSFNSRGLPSGVNNRKVFVRRGPIADSLTLSRLGRVMRAY